MPFAGGLTFHDGSLCRIPFIPWDRILKAEFFLNELIYLIIIYALCKSYHQQKNNLS